MADRFRYLRPALAAILVFVGAKMVLSHTYHLPVAVSLAVIVLILAAAALGSVFAERRTPTATARERPPAREPLLSPEHPRR